ncbi:MAG: hypothetical protein JWM57_2679 [Phycisphaerales bacterium]|nr:hypothetical protein [Phycisphaerales bacterium]
MTTANPLFVEYIRVSTQKQGRSGLGLEAQQKMIADHIAGVGGKIVGQFVEVESGSRHENRPELRKALAMARKLKATLIVAKLDRLARNVAFVSALLDTPGVEFRAADFPNASRMMIQLLAVFGEYERDMIGKRTKDALAARKARGFALGNIANLNQGQSDIAEQNKAKAAAEAERLRPIIEHARRAGHTSVRALAAHLNDRGYTTERGSSWHPTSIARVLARLDGRREVAVVA